MSFSSTKIQHTIFRSKTFSRENTLVFQEKRKIVKKLDSWSLRTNLNEYQYQQVSNAR